MSSSFTSKEAKWSLFNPNTWLTYTYDSSPIFSIGFFVPIKPINENPCLKLTESIKVDPMYWNQSLTLLDKFCEHSSLQATIIMCSYWKPLEMNYSRSAELLYVSNTFATITFYETELKTTICNPLWWPLWLDYTAISVP